MIATVRSLTGTAPLAYVGDSTAAGQRPDPVPDAKVSRVFRSRVVNPGGSARCAAGMEYKGAFELAATVDYLFGWDATTGVVADWMYEQLTASYVLDPQTRQFLETSNPWSAARDHRAAAPGGRPWPVGGAGGGAAGGAAEIYLQVEGQLQEAHAMVARCPAAPASGNPGNLAVRYYLAARLPVATGIRPEAAVLGDRRPRMCRGWPTCCWARSDPHIGGVLLAGEEGHGQDGHPRPGPRPDPARYPSVVAGCPVLLRARGPGSGLSRRAAPGGAAGQATAPPAWWSCRSGNADDRVTGSLDVPRRAGRRPPPPEGVRARAARAGAPRRAAAWTRSTCCPITWWMCCSTRRRPAAPTWSC